MRRQAFGTLLCTFLLAVADPGASPAPPPSTGPNSFVFSSISTEKLVRRGQRPPLGWRPPTGNPGSAAGWLLSLNFFNFTAHLLEI